MKIKILFLIGSLIYSSLGNFIDKPNIIFILLDDLGKEWISCYGGENIKTPHIDKPFGNKIKCLFHAAMYSKCLLPYRSVSFSKRMG